MTELNVLTERIIGCAIEVHRHLGPGLLGATYETAMTIELEEANPPCERQCSVPALYKERVIGEYRIDLVVNRTVIVEIKSVERLDPVFAAQVLTYLRVTGLTIGLLINFNSRLLKYGIRRFIMERVLNHVDEPKC